LRTVRKPGRPKTSKLTRAEQLRRAKRRQRARQRAAGIVHVQLAVPRELAEKMAAARRADLLTRALGEALDRTVVRVHDYPQLADLAWNQSDEFMPAREAFQLYERNWRFVDANALLPGERRLIERLKAEFGSGVMNA
jgi:hypothetical protein